MSHDENAYANPMTFNPERFLGPKAEPDPMILCLDLDGTVSSVISTV